MEKVLKESPWLRLWFDLIEYLRLPNEEIEREYPIYKEVENPIKKLSIPFAWEETFSAVRYNDKVVGIVKYRPVTHLYVEFGSEKVTEPHFKFAKSTEDFKKLFLYQFKKSEYTNMLYFRDEILKKIENNLKIFQNGIGTNFRGKQKNIETLRDYLQYLSALNESNLPIDNNGDLFPMDIINKVIEWNKRYRVFENVSNIDLHNFLNNIETTDIHLKIIGKDRYLGLIRFLQDRKGFGNRWGVVCMEKADNSSPDSYTKKGKQEARKVQNEIDL